VIVLDSSILVGIIKGEEDATALLGLLAGEECVIGAPTLVETRAWCTINLASGSSRWLEHFIGAGPGSIVPSVRKWPRSRAGRLPPLAGPAVIPPG
jgi:uncharacterized protein with PIN domain